MIVGIDEKHIYMVYHEINTKQKCIHDQPCTCNINMIRGIDETRSPKCDVWKGGGGNERWKNMIFEKVGEVIKNKINE